MSKEDEVVPEQTDRTHDIQCLVASLHEVITRRMDERMPFVIRISGYSALGKSTIARQLADSFTSAVIIPTDSYMLDREERRARDITSGDDPQTIDFAGLHRDVDQLASGNAVTIRLYNHQTGKHEGTKLLTPSNIIIIEGASALYDEIKILHPSISIFLDADDDTKIKHRHDVNVNERGYTEEQFLTALPGYLEAYKKFIQPSMANADYVCTVDVQSRYESPLITNCVC